MTEGTSEQSSSAALKPSDFVHLHNHTFHSVLDGLTKIHDLVDKVKELGMEAAAVTDHGTMSGILDYYKTAKKRELSRLSELKLTWRLVLDLIAIRAKTSSVFT